MLWSMLAECLPMVPHVRAVTLGRGEEGGRRREEEGGGGRRREEEGGRGKVGSGQKVPCMYVYVYVYVYSTRFAGID